MSEHHGKVWWSELQTSDVAKSKAQYAKVLGWTYDEMPSPDGPYYIAKQGDASVAGIMARPAEMGDAPDQWVTYLACDNVDTAVKDVEASGGSVLAQPFDVPNVGRIAMIADSTGAVLGIMTPT